MNGEFLNAAPTKLREVKQEKFLPLNNNGEYNYY